MHYAQSRPEKQAPLALFSHSQLVFGHHIDHTTTSRPQLDGVLGEGYGFKEVLMTYAFCITNVGN